MREDLAELKLLLPLKNSTDVGDIILIVAKPEDQLMLQYAIVTDIVRDTNKRDEWWVVSFTMLAIPLQQGSLILRTEQMTGQEVFTIGGEERFVSAVEIEKPSSLPDLSVVSSKKTAGKETASTKSKPNHMSGIKRIK